MEILSIVSIIGLVLLIAVVLFITLRKKKSDNSSQPLKEYLSIDPALQLTTIYGERPPTCNYLNWKASQLPI